MGSEITGLDDRHAYLKLGNSVARFAFDYMDLPAQTPAFVPRVSADAGIKFDPDTLAPILQPESKKVPSDKTEDVVESAESFGPFDRQHAPAGMTQAEAQERAISPVEAVPTEAIEESPELEEELTQGPELIREM